jgi:hypothetical protein
MQTWPAEFPLPNVDLSASLEPNTIRTTMDSGATRQRRRFSSDVITVDASWSLSDTEFGVFIAYHDYRLNAGNDWFEMPLPLGGGVHVHVVRFVEGKFDQQYDEVSYWTVSAKLEVVQRVKFSPELLSFYLDIGFSESATGNLLSLIDSFHNCVHVTLPNNLN